MSERLDHALASRLLLSRKEARQRIRAGEVLVGGTPVRDPAAHVDPAAQTVTVGGQALRADAQLYLMLNKPAGVLSATEDRSGMTTALDLLPAPYRKAGLGVVGRLDRDAEGLLLLTNDGALNHRLTSPNGHAVKRYAVTLDAPVGAAEIAAFAAGLELEDFTARPAVLLPQEGAAALVDITEGKFHQVKRMFACCGRTVLTLRRLSIGPLVLDPALAPGGWRELTDGERDALRRY